MTRVLHFFELISPEERQGPPPGMVMGAMA